MLLEIYYHGNIYYSYYFLSTSNLTECFSHYLMFLTIHTIRPLMQSFWLKFSANISVLFLWYIWWPLLCPLFSRCTHVPQLSNFAYSCEECVWRNAQIGRCRPKLPNRTTSKIQGSYYMLWPRATRLSNCLPLVNHNTSIISIWEMYWSIVRSVIDKNLHSQSFLQCFVAYKCKRNIVLLTYWYSLYMVFHALAQYKVLITNNLKGP